MDPIQSLIEQGAAQHVYSCAAYAIGTPDRLLKEGYAGCLGEGRAAAEQDTIYDLASVTKVLVTMAFMRLFEQGKVCLEDTVALYLPQYRGTNKETITLWQLLTHTSVLHGQAPLYRSAHTKEDLLEAIRQLPPRDNSTVEYSSQGFIVLGQVMEAIEDKALDQILQEQLFTPLNMEHTTYNPPAAWQSRIASTENCPWRGHVVIGQVHDENAVVLGGVAAHAGIFSNTQDLIQVARAMLTGRTPEGQRYLHEATIRLMTQDHTGAMKGTQLARGLGWQVKSAHRPSPFGDLFLAASYGHTGFTGTGIFIDPTRQLFTVLLTNRVHPTRHGSGIEHIRRTFNNLAVLLAEE